MTDAENTSAPIKVGLVDDHALLRKMLKIYIVSHWKDCVVTIEADHGSDLVDQMATLPISQHPDVVLLDIDMPRMDGYETLRWLKQHTPDIKVVMLSVFGDENTIIRCLRMGANAYLTKNVEVEELIQTIRVVSEKGEYYSSYIAGIAVASLKQQGPADKPAPAAGLTKKEAEFLQLICTEMTYNEIADRMYISTRTADGYRDQLFLKLNVKTRVGLAIHAIRNKLITI